LHLRTIDVFQLTEGIPFQDESSVDPRRHGFQYKRHHGPNASGRDNIRAQAPTTAFPAPREGGTFFSLTVLRQRKEKKRPFRLGSTGSSCLPTPVRLVSLEVGIGQPRPVGFSMLNRTHTPTDPRRGKKLVPPCLASPSVDQT